MLYDVLMAKMASVVFYQSYELGQTQGYFIHPILGGILQTYKQINENLSARKGNKEAKVRWPDFLYLRKFRLRSRH